MGRRRLRDHTRRADPDRRRARRPVRAAARRSRSGSCCSAPRRSSAASPGTSQSLDVARALQGVGGAALFATALALIGAEYQGPSAAERDRDLGLDGRLRRRGRAAARRDHHRLAQLALDLLRQRPGRRLRARARRVRNVRESRDPRRAAPTSPGCSRSPRRSFLIVFGLLRGNDAGWGERADRRTSLIGGLALLAAFVAASRCGRSARCSTSRSSGSPRFVGVQLATFCLGAGMFALFPFLSIYLQDIDGNSRARRRPALPADHRVHLRRSARDAEVRGARRRCGLLLGASLAIVAVGLLLMEIVSVGSRLDGASPRLHRLRDRHRPGEPDDRRGCAARRRSRRGSGWPPGSATPAAISGLAVGVAALGVAAAAPHRHQPGGRRPSRQAPVGRGHVVRRARRARQPDARARRDGGVRQRLSPRSC